MRISTALARVGAMVLAVCVLTGCASVAQRNTPGQAPGVALPAATYAGSPDRVITYPNIGVTLKPSGNALAAKDWSSIYTSCDKTICPTTSGPTVYLALATTDNNGSIGTDGAVKATTVDRLSYAMVWTGVPCSPSGHAPGDTSAPVKSKCTVVVLVDATTGAFLGSAQTNAVGG